MTTRGKMFRSNGITFAFAIVAPTFQKLMNTFLALVKRRPAMRPWLGEEIILRCNVDDVRLGANTMDDHLVLLKEFLDECKINHAWHESSPTSGERGGG